MRYEIRGSQCYCICKSPINSVEGIRYAATALLVVHMYQNTQNCS